MALRLALPTLLAALLVAAFPSAASAARCNERAAPMSVCDAKAFVKDVARWRTGERLTFTRLSCRRKSPRSFSCRVTFFMGDVSWKGSARVGFRNQFRSDDYYDFRLTYTNHYTDRSKRERWRCSRMSRC